MENKTLSSERLKFTVFRFKRTTQEVIPLEIGRKVHLELVRFRLIQNFSLAGVHAAKFF